MNFWRPWSAPAVPGSPRPCKCFNIDLVRAKRGEVTIIDRVGLMELTHGAYGEEEQRYFGLATAA